MSQSEVVCLRRQIELECEAMQRVFTEFAASAIRHEFIRTRMEHLSNYQEKLATYVGDCEAARIVAEIYTELQEPQNGSEKGVVI